MVVVARDIGCAYVIGHHEVVDKREVVQTYSHGGLDRQIDVLYVGHIGQDRVHGNYAEILVLSVTVDQMKLGMKQNSLHRLLGTCRKRFDP